MRKLISSLLVIAFGLFLVSSVNLKANGPLVEAIDGASIREKVNGEIEQGLRFYAKLNSEADEHGFYLVFGEATVQQLKDALTEQGQAEFAELNGKDVYRVDVPGVTQEKEYSVVLTGIPGPGYLQNISVFPYAVVGKEETIVESVTRSVGEVALKAANAGEVNQDVIVELEANFKRLGMNAFGELELTGDMFETNHFLLREEFIKDWNAKFGTEFEELDATAFFNSAKEGLTDAIGSNKDLSDGNLYNFFNDKDYKDKWEWLLDFMFDECGITHAKRQVTAIKGNGTNEGHVLYLGDQLSHSITNFFNQEHKVGGYTAINFTQMIRYDRFIGINDKQKVYNENVYINLLIYEFYKPGDKFEFEAAPSKDGYNFANYKVGEQTYLVGSQYEVTSSNVLFELDYTLISYTVKFYDDELELENIEATYNIETGLLLPTPEKEGYKFIGWYDNDQLSGSIITTIEKDEIGDKTYYAEFEQGFSVTYNFGEYGYISDLTKAQFFEDFAEDYREFNGLAGSADVLGNFNGASYGKQTFGFFNDSVYGAKWGWFKEYLEELKVKTGYAGDLATEAVFRSNIHHFFLETAKESMPQDWLKPMNFYLPELANGFWKKTEYNQITEDFVSEGNLFDSSTITSSNIVYGFEGWYTDAALTIPITNLPETTEANIVLYAKWEKVAFYVNFNLGYDSPAPQTQLIVKNGKVIEPNNPERINYIFVGWYKNLQDDNAYDFNSLVTDDFTLYAKWEEDMGDEYSITYELNGGKMVHGTKTEMINGFLEDFYEYLGLTISMSDFKHGVGNASGYDGLWHSQYKSSIYTAGRPTAYNNDYFASSEAYMNKWLPFFDMMEVFTEFGNQSFWNSTWTGLIRIRQYVIGSKPDASWPDEQMIMMPNPLIEASAITDGMVGLEITLQIAVKEGFTFGGWYDNSELEGVAITKLNPETADDVTLYAKWE